MDAATALKTQDDKFHSLGLTKSVVNKEQVNCYSRALDAASTDNPILVLIHGYPQSAYMWRHLIPLLPPTAPLFVPDVPGYGASPPTASMDKQTVGTALLSALQSLINQSTTPPASTPIVLIGHDRGARIAHRLAVSNPTPSLPIQGTCLIDIVPTSVQWQHNAPADTAARQIAGYFHWPFLANVDLAVRMITAFGPGAWCEEMTLRWAGSNARGLGSLKADGALGVYNAFFAQEQTLRASCEDYEAGAGVDVEAQVRDQEAGRRIEGPLLLVYSKDYIGSRYDMVEAWKEWAGEGVRVEKCELGDGVGHFGVEEAPEESAKALGEWLKGLK